MADTKKTGSFGGKSNRPGEGGRAAQLKAQGVPGGVIGDIARKKGEAPGQKGFHPDEKKNSSNKDAAKKLMSGGKYDT